MSEKGAESHLFSRFRVDKQLGAGTFGTVWRAREVETKRRVAIKMIGGAFGRRSVARTTFREVMLLQELKHPFIIKLYETVRSENNVDVFLVFEYVEMNLLHALHAGMLETVHKQACIHQILRGVQYLHSRRVMHRDLKPANILIDKQCHVRICDFGMARGVRPTRARSHAMCSSRNPSAAPGSPGSPSRQGSLAQGSPSRQGSLAQGLAGTRYESLLVLGGLCSEPQPLRLSFGAGSATRGDGIALLCRAADIVPAVYGAAAAAAAAAADSEPDEADEDVCRGRGMTVLAATQWYCGPEVLLCSESYNFPADLWSLGCILGELFLCRPMFPGSSKYDQLAKIFSATGKPTEEDIIAFRAPQVHQTLGLVRVNRPGTLQLDDAPKEAQDLLQALLVLNPDRRPTADEVLALPWFAETERTLGPPEPPGPPVELPFDGPDDEAVSASVYRDELYARADVKPLPEPPISETPAPSRQVSVAVPAGAGEPATSRESQRQASTASSAKSAKKKKDCAVQ